MPDKPNVVEGIIANTSFKFIFGIMGAGILGVLFGLFLLYARSTQGTFSISGLIIAIGGGLMMTVSVIMLFDRHHLVFGEEFLQVVNQKGKVITQIPYANMARVRRARNEDKLEYVAVSLLDPRDPATYDERGAEHFTKQLGEWKCHFVIVSGYTMSLDEIRELLLERIEHDEPDDE